MAGGWLLLGVIWLAWLSVTAPDKVEQFGTVLAEGGDEPEAPRSEPALSP